MSPKDGEESISIYSEEDRKKTLTLLLKTAEEDSRIGAAIVVGSGAYGFIDEYSDIDLCFVVQDKDEVCAVFESWRRKITQLLSVFEHTESVRGPNSLLHVIFLENCLEVDIGFICAEELTARREHWNVRFDRFGGIAERLASTWEEKKQSAQEILENYYRSRLKAIWHYIQHAVVAYKRGRLWQALSDIQDIRQQAISLHGYRIGLEPGRYKEVDEMEEPFQGKLKSTLVGKIDKDGVKEAIEGAVECFFSEARHVDNKLGLELAPRMEEKMKAYLAELL
jgi:predicted nucleotidyltransferase